MVRVTRAQVIGSGGGVIGVGGAHAVSSAAAVLTAAAWRMLRRTCIRRWYAVPITLSSECIARSAIDPARRYGRDRQRPRDRRGPREHRAGTAAAQFGRGVSSPDRHRAA